MDILLNPSPDVDPDLEMQALPGWLQDAIELYQRCRLFKEIAMPCSGGVLQQDALTVNVLQAIHRRVVEDEAERTVSHLERIRQSGKPNSESFSIGKSYSRKARG